MAAMGRNGGGLALNGDGTMLEWAGQYPPVQVGGLDGAAAIAVGPAYSTVLKRDGTVWQWNGQSAPRQVSDLSGVRAVAHGESRTFAAKVDGTVWAWNDDVKLIQVAELRGVVGLSVAVEQDWWGVGPIPRVLARKDDGTVWTWGEYTSGSPPIQVRGLSNVTAIAGSEISLALKNDGTVWEWQGLSEPWPVRGLTEVVAVAAGGSTYFGVPHRLALKADGTVWAWGGNGFGQLGDGTAVDRATPVQVQGLSEVLAIAAAGHIYYSPGSLEVYEGSWGVYELQPVSLAVKRDGTVWMWGWTAPRPAQVFPPPQ
jgi:alpha-tubulin suppressor-like RCC1 family protein